MLSNEEYLESKNLKIYTTVDNIEQNIIKDPQLIPNGLHQANNKNSNNLLEEQLNKLPTNSNNLLEEQSSPSPSSNHPSPSSHSPSSNHPSPSSHSPSPLEEESNEKIENMVKQKNVNTYASQLLANLTKKPILKNKNNNSKKLLQNSRNRLNLEIIKVFPLSLIILLLIFIILLVVCIGIN